LGEEDTTVARVVLKGGCVLSFDKRIGNLEEADVLIEDDRIVEVARDVRARDAEVVDASESIVMPGFVDTHRHAWMTILRHSGALEAAGGDPVGIDTISRNLQPDDVYASTLLGLVSAATSGITTVVDLADVPADERFAEAALQAHADSGLRTVFVVAEPAWAAATSEPGAGLRRAVELAASAPMTTVAHGSLELPLGDEGPMAAGWRIARELGLRIHAHAGGAATDRGRVAEVARRSLLGEDVTLSHCAGLDDEDLDAVAASGASVALTPCSDMACGLGSPSMQPLIDRAIRPGLGVGDERWSPGDLFAQMRAVQSVQRATVFDRKLAGKAALPHLLSTREVIRYATVEGARVAGLSDRTGTLGRGKQADVIALRADRPNIAPINDPIGAVVWGMDPSNVDWVFVGGRPLVRAGELSLDVARVRAAATAAHQRLTRVVTPVSEASGDGAAR
jgi:5-methylthioadenosine/S-adenosylhomocysteine deaminase